MDQTVHAGYIKVGNVIQVDNVLAKVLSISEETNSDGREVTCLTARHANGIIRDYYFLKYVPAVILLDKKFIVTGTKVQ